MSPEGSANDEAGEGKLSQEDDFMTADFEDFSVDMDGHDPSFPSTDMFLNNNTMDQHVPHLICKYNVKQCRLPRS